MSQQNSLDSVLVLSERNANECLNIIILKNKVKRKNRLQLAFFLTASVKNL